MNITKEEVIEIVKKNGLNEEEAALFLQVLAKKSGGALVDLVKLIAERTENKIDDMIVAAGESTLRDMVDAIEVKL